MSAALSHERFLADAEPDLARLARGPGNAGALAGLRAAFARARTEAGPGPAAELARAAENLLSAQLEGHVPPTAEAADLVDQAARGLAALSPADRADLAERMDAVASGLSTTTLDRLPPQRAGRPAPPLLTEREDGVQVTPGMFADQAAPPPKHATSTTEREDGVQVTPSMFADQDVRPPAPATHIAEAPPQTDASPTPLASSTVPPQPLPEPGLEAHTDAAAEPPRAERPASPAPAEAQAIVAGVEAALKNLERQLVALTTIASGDDPVSAAVQHTAGELAATAAELERHKRALATWLDDAGAGRV